MQQYMVTIKLPSELSQDFIRLIPQQRDQVNRLMDKGKLIQYTLAEDRSMLWMVVVAEDEEAVGDLLSTFPLAPYFNATIHPLMFHNSISSDLPKLIMN